MDANENGGEFEVEDMLAASEDREVSGNGYSNGGEETAKGVPTICEGE